MRGPGQFNIDMSLIKYTRFGRFNLELRLEAFNLLNHPQFQLPNRTFNAALRRRSPRCCRTRRARCAERPSGTSSSRRSCRSDRLSRSPGPAGFGSPGRFFWRRCRTESAPASCAVTAAACPASCSRSPSERASRSRPQRAPQGRSRRRTQHGRRRSSAPTPTASRSRRSSGAPAACCTRGWPTPTSARCCCPTCCPGYKRGPKGLHIYRPHNSGADNYPYLVATAWFTDRALYEGRLREMLRNEIRFTNAPDGIPGELNLETGMLGPAEPVRRRRVRQGRPARDHRAARAHAVVLPHGRHDRRPDAARAGARATSGRCRTRAPSSTATCCRRWSGSRR